MPVPDVLMISPIANDQDGVGQYTEDLVEHLSEASDVEQSKFESCANPFSYLWCLKDIINTDAKIIHIQHGYLLFGPLSLFSWFYFPLLWLITSVLDQKVVLTIHEALNPDLMTPPLKPLKQWYIVYLNKLIIAASDQVIFLSSHAEERFSENVSTAVQLPHGSKTADISDYTQAEAKADFGYENQQTLIVEPGYVSKRKGSHILSDIATNLPKYEFLLAGGASSQKHQNFVYNLQKESPKNLNISGVLSNQEFLASFVAADVIVLPYVQDEQSGIINKVNQSGIFNWCAAYSKPVLASDNQYFRSIRNEWDCVELMPVEDIDKSADKLVELVNNKEKRRHMCKNIAVFNRQNSFDNVAQKHDELYISLTSAEES